MSRPLLQLVTANAKDKFCWLEQPTFPRIVPYAELRPGAGDVRLDDERAYIVATVSGATEPVLFVFVDADEWPEDAGEA